MQAAADSKLQKNLLVVIAGPTASGKTDMAIAVAEHFNTCVLSADSRQCYRELNIGVARSDREQLATVPHFFIATHSIHQEVTAATFEQYGLYVLGQLFSRHRVVVMAGGTGLYIKALLEGMDAMPSIPEPVRAQVRQSYEDGGIALLEKLLHQYDPRYVKEGEMKNPQRMMRALEIAMHTGTSIRTLQQGQKAKRNFDVLYLTLQAPAQWLNPRIALRTERMIAQGLVKEAEPLFEYNHFNALQTVGYKEIFNYFYGTVSLEEATALITVHTRQYAKRQRTWFARVAQAIPIAPGATWQAIELINKKLLTLR